MTINTSDNQSREIYFTKFGSSKVNSLIKWKNEELNTFGLITSIVHRSY